MENRVEGLMLGITCDCWVWHMSAIWGPTSYITGNAVTTVCVGLVSRSHIDGKKSPMYMSMYEGSKCLRDSPRQACPLRTEDNIYVGKAKCAILPGDKVSNDWKVVYVTSKTGERNVLVVACRLCTSTPSRRKEK